MLGVNVGIPVPREPFSEYQAASPPPLPLTKYSHARRCTCSQKSIYHHTLRCRLRWSIRHEIQVRFNGHHRRRRNRILHESDQNHKQMARAVRAGVRLGAGEEAKNGHRRRSCQLCRHDVGKQLRARSATIAGCHGESLEFKYYKIGSWNSSYLNAVYCLENHLFYLDAYIL